MRSCLRRAAWTAALLSVSLAGDAKASDNVLIDLPSVGLPVPTDAVSDSSSGGTDVMSDTGRYVVFRSGADGILAGDDDVAGHVYRKDLQTGAIVQVDAGPVFGTQPLNGADSAAVSADGMTVAFRTRDRFAEADANGSYDVYVRHITGADGSGTTELVSCAITGPCTGDPGFVQTVAISGDGLTVAWTTDADLAAGDTHHDRDAYARKAGVTTAVSLGNDDAFLGGFVDSLSISSTGTRIAFCDRPNYPVKLGSDTNSTADVFVRDMSAGETHLISRAPDATTPTAAGGTYPSISSAGTLVVFATSAALAAGDANTIGDVYTMPTIAASALAPSLRSVLSGTTTAGGGSSPAISGDGDVYSFLSDGGLISPAVTGEAQIYTYDRTTAATKLISRSDGASGAPSHGNLFVPATDATGDHVAFTHTGGALTQDADTHSAVVYVRDAVAGTTVVASRPAGSAAFAGGAGTGSIAGRGGVVSGEGRYVVFSSDAGDLTAAGGSRGVFRRDLVTGATERIDIGPNGTPGDANASAPTISEDGTRIAFLSSATNLATGAGGLAHLYVRDLAVRTTVLVDRTTAGAVAPGSAGFASLSADGSTVGFVSNAALDPVADTNAIQDVYVVPVAGGPPTLVSRANGADGAAADGLSQNVTLDRAGRRVAFATVAANLGDGDTTNTLDIHLRDLDAQTTQWISRTPAGAANGASYDAQIAQDGRSVAFKSDATDLDPADTTLYSDIYVAGLDAGTMTLASRHDGASGEVFGAGVGAFAYSSSTRSVAFAAADQDGVGRDLWVRDLAAGRTTQELTRPDGSPSLPAVSSVAITDNARCLVAASQDPLLTSGGYASRDFTHVYLVRRFGPCATPVPPGPEPIAIAGPAADTTKPKITKLSLASRTFRVAKAKTRRGRRAPLGTKLRLTLSEDAKLTLTIERRTTGRRSAKSCVKTTRANRKKRRCTRYVKVRTLSASGKLGRVSLTFKPSKLAAGAYRVGVQAKDAAGNRSTTVRMTFTVVR